MGRRRQYREPRAFCNRAGKLTYPTRLEALDQLGRLDHAHRPRAEARAYLCGHCGAYHLTSLEDHREELDTWQT